MLEDSFHEGYDDPDYDDCFLMTQQALVGQGLLIIEPLRSHSDTPHLLGLLWTSDQPDAENSTWQHKTLTRDRHPRPPRDSNPQFKQASGRRTPPYTARPPGYDDDDDKNNNKHSGTTTV